MLQSGHRLGRRPPRNCGDTARRIVAAKKLFNIRAGWTPAEDTLPARFFDAAPGGRPGRPAHPRATGRRHPRLQPPPRLDRTRLVEAGYRIRTTATACPRTFFASCRRCVAAGRSNQFVLDLLQERRGRRSRTLAAPQPLASMPRSSRSRAGQADEEQPPLFGHVRRRPRRPSATAAGRPRSRPGTPREIRDPWRRAASAATRDRPAGPTRSASAPKATSDRNRATSSAAALGQRVQRRSGRRASGCSPHTASAACFSSSATLTGAPEHGRRACSVPSRAWTAGSSVNRRCDFFWNGMPDRRRLRPARRLGLPCGTGRRNRRTPRLSPSCVSTRPLSSEKNVEPPISRSIVWTTNSASARSVGAGRGSRSGPCSPTATAGDRSGPARSARWPAAAARDDRLRGAVVPRQPHGAGAGEVLGEAQEDLRDSRRGSSRSTGPGRRSRTSCRPRGDQARAADTGCRPGPGTRRPRPTASGGDIARPTRLRARATRRQQDQIVEVHQALLAHRLPVALAARPSAAASTVPRRRVCSARSRPAGDRLGARTVRASTNSRRRPGRRPRGKSGGKSNREACSRRIVSPSA